MIDINFQNYIVDPNKHKFSHVVRIVALIIRFIDNLKRKIRSLSKDDIIDVKELLLNEDEIKNAEKYFYRIASEEVKHFQKKKLTNFVEKEGVLHYKGRILPSEVNIVTPLSETMKDLTNTNFFVPAVEKHSPIAYAIVSDIHWNHRVVKAFRNRDHLEIRVAKSVHN